jgi:hypothetical protein
MRVKNRIVIVGVFCGLGALATARVATADSSDGDPQAERPTATAPADRGGGGGGGGSRGGVLAVKGNVIGAYVDDAAVVLQSDSVLSLNGTGTVSFVATQPGAMARAAYLGVTTTAPDTALQKQLQLKPGVGLVVDSVDPDGPAEKAGVRQYDVLHKLDEQLLINSEQLGVLVRSYEPGKEVKLTVIREGKSQTLTAKLGEHIVPPMRLRLVAPTAPGRVATATFQPMLEARNAFVPNGAVLVHAPGGQQQNGAAEITIDDGTRKLTISTASGHKRMRGQDKSGKVIFDLPADTKEELEKVAPEYRKLYQDLPQVPPATAPTTPGPQPTPAPEPLPAPQR